MVGQLPCLNELFTLQFGDELNIDEAIDDLREATLRGFDLGDRIKARWRTNEASEKRSLDHVELRCVLAEVHLGRCLQAVRVVAEEDSVEVALEDLALGHLLLEHGGEVGLQNLVTAIAR